MAKQVKKVAFLTAGGLAPCLSASIGFLTVRPSGLRQSEAILARNLQ